MNCPLIREQLPDLLYGALTPEAAVQVEAHLAGCAACRGDFEALKQVRQALEAMSPVTATVDLPRLYRTVAQAQERRLRRWRRTAFVLAGLAAALVLFALLPNLEFRWETHQVAVRWGTPPAPASTPPPTPAPQEALPERPQFVSTTAPDVEERLRMLSDLVQLLADGADRRDERRRRDLETLRTQLTELRDQARQWRLSTERGVAALYALQFPETKKGEKP